jgi:hypothetical protein
VIDELSDTIGEGAEPHLANNAVVWYKQLGKQLDQVPVPDSANYDISLIWFECIVVLIKGK